MTTGPIRPEQPLTPLSSAHLERGQKKGEDKVSLEIQDKTVTLSAKVLGKGLKKVFQQIKAKILAKKYTLLKAHDPEQSGRMRTVIVKTSDLAKELGVGRKEVKKLVKPEVHSAAKRKVSKRERQKTKKVVKKHFDEWVARAKKGEGGATHISRSMSGLKHSLTVTEKGDVYRHTGDVLGKGGFKVVKLARNIFTKEYVAVWKIKNNSKAAEVETKIAKTLPNLEHVAQTRGVTDYTTKNEVKSTVGLMRVYAGSLEPPIGNYHQGLSEAAEGLTNLHAVGVAHLDVKNENIFTRMDGHADIADLGAARNMRSMIEEAITALKQLQKITASIEEIDEKKALLEAKYKEKKDPMIQKQIKELKDKRTELTNQRMEIEPIVDRVWGQPEYSLIFLSPEWVKESPARKFLPQRGNLRDLGQQGALIGKLKELLKSEQQMENVNRTLFARDTFALATCIYQHRTGKESTPWQDVKTIVKNGFTLAIADIDERIRNEKDEGKRKKLVAKKLALVNNPQKQQKLTQLLSEDFPRLEEITQEYTTKKEKLRTDLKMEMNRLGISEEKLQNLMNGLETTDKTKISFATEEEQQIFNQFRIRGDKIVALKHQQQAIEKRLQKDYKEAFGLTLPLVFLDRMELLANLTRKHQQSLGYVEPPKRDLLAHLEWEMHDPDPDNRPSMEDVTRRLQQIATLEATGKEAQRARRRTT